MSSTLADAESASVASNARPVGRPPKRIDQRQRILQAVARVIATVGYEQCALGDIAAELDLTRQALYHYFPTKQRIFNEIAMTTVRGMYEHARAAVSEVETPDEKLHALMLAHAEYFDRYYWMVNATIAGYGGITRREIEQLEEFEACRLDYEKLLMSIIREGVKQGRFRTIDPKSVARSVFQLLNITRWYRPDGKKNAQDFARENYELIAAAIAAVPNA